MILIKFCCRYVFRRYCTAHSNVRVRFAPSPTGYMHLGGLRTAFYNYLFARKNKGRFILRIEDTDQKRVKPGSLENLYAMLEWTGLIPNESPKVGGPFAPYVQSKRLKIYQEKANHLLESGAAYRCFCSETRLQILRKEAQQNRSSYGYDNKCRFLTDAEINDFLQEGKSFTIRFKIPEGSISHKDIVFGFQEYNLAENEGDFIILKSDGFPTYHFSCVVDDHLMKISHVLRGSEWLISTCKHIALFKAFGWKSPEYAHLPLLMNSDRTKLSKRQESVGVEYFKNKAYSPEALLNFLAAASGFGRQDDYCVHDMDTLCSKFELTNIHTNSCIVDLRKLDHFNHNHLLKQLCDDNLTSGLVERLRTVLKEKYDHSYKSEEQNLTDVYMKRILSFYKDRITNIQELATDDLKYLWTAPDSSEIINKLSELKIFHEFTDGLTSIESLLSSLSESEFTQDILTSKLKNESKKLSIPYSAFMRSLRICLTGQKDGPGVAEILVLLGKARSIQRITTIIEKLNKSKFARDASQ